MSHTVEIKDLLIRDLAALGRAATRLGLELVMGQTNYRWYGTVVGDHPFPTGFTNQDIGKCEHAIRIPNQPDAYEIGIVTRRDGLLAMPYIGTSGKAAMVSPTESARTENFSDKRTLSKSPSVT